MHYLVAGGAGFLGSHMVDRLIARGHQVTVVDNLVSGSYFNVNKQARFIDWDITFPLQINNLDAIMNFASPASPIHYQKIPIETLTTNVIGSLNLLRLAQENKCKILQTSTSEVYGDPEITPQPESYRGCVNSYGPRACYDEGKRAAEALFYDFKRVHGVNTRIVRIFNTYGPRMAPNDGRVVSTFIRQALLGENLTIFGDGQQTRSFCYVEDLLNAIDTVWNSSYTSPVNIGNPGEFTMLELAEKVLAITGSKSTIVHEKLPEDDPTQRCPDITLVKSMGWEPKIALDTGLRYTVQYMRRLLKE